MNTRLARTYLAFVPFVFALGACSGGGEDVEITAFSATPLVVVSGGTTNLAWTTTHATKITVSADPGGELVNSTDASGSATSGPITADTKFTLTADGEGGPISRSVMVTVMGNTNAPMVTSFMATPSTIAPGGSASLSWATQNADSVTITNGAGATIVDAGAASGNQTVMPADTTTYTLVATGAGGMAMSTVTVTVDANPIVTSFTATPNTIDPGDSSTLAWNVSNADNVTITDGAGTEVYNDSGLMASVSVMPAMTTTYTLVATNPDGTATAMAMVTVNPPTGPAVNAFTATPMTINLGEQVTLAWNVSNANTVSISDGAATTTTSTSLTGSIALRPIANTTYTLTAADGTNPDATAMVSVTVNAAAPAILDFSATPNPAALGGTTTLGFEVIGAQSVRVLRGATEIYTGTQGVDTIVETLNASSTSYTLEATNATGTSMAMLVVDAHAAPAINSLEVTPTTFQGTVTATLAFDVSDTASLALYVNGAIDTAFTGVGTPTTAIDATGTYSVSVSASTTFRLVATSAGGTVERTVSVQQTTGKTEPNDDAATAFPYPTNGNVVTGEIAPGGDEDWYAITVPAGYSIRAETSDGMGGCPFDTILTFTSTDGVTTLAFDDDDGIGNCSLIDPTNPADAGATNLAAGTYYIVVAPYSTGTGPYVIDVQVIAPACGNGIRDGADLCDDGNTANGDGCDSQCMLEIANAYTAPGAPMTFTASIAVVGQVYTYEITATAPAYIAAETFSNAAAGTCSIDTEIFLLDSTGALLGSDDFDGVNSCSATRPGVDTWARLDVGTYYLTVTEDDNDALAYFELVLEGIPADVCGNGVVDGANEQCDDGNTMLGDGCSATCQVESLATFVATNGAMQTFAGNSLAVGQVDSFLVQVPAGADVYLRVETFDNATAGTCVIDTVLRLLDSTATQLGTNDEGGIGSCSLIAYTAPYARLSGGTNYFVTVEDYLLNTAIANYDVVFSAVTADICGNGVLDNAGTETCDDGNTTPGDGCDATCQVELAPPFTATPGATVTYTGGLAVGQVAQYTVIVPAGNDVYLRAETFEDAMTGTCPNIDTEIFLLDSNGTEIGGDDQDGVGSCSLMTPVTDAFMRLATGTYTVTVEDWLLDDPIQSYDLVLDAIATDICGNGVIEVGEQCDDGNTVGGDTCPATCVFASTLSGSSTPALAIPDNDPTGVSDTLTLPASPACTVANVSVDMDISHTYQGDLIVDLTSPGGTTVRLWDQTGFGNNDIIGNFPATLTPAGSLANFNGGAGNGVWTLFVSDNANLDTGTINSWGLTIGCQ